MPTFTTSLTPPPAPSGFTINVDTDASAVRLAWDPSAIAPEDFVAFTVYRSLNGGVTWETLAVLTSTDSTSYDDFLAPLNVDLVYRLTQANIDFESDPVDAAAMLDSLQWWVVVADDSSLTFPIRKMQAASVTSPKVQEVFAPIGRPGRLVVGDVVQIEDGEVSFLVMPDDLGAVALWRAVQARMEGGLTLKATDGSTWSVQFGDLRRSFTAWGGQALTVPFTGVG